MTTTNGKMAALAYNNVFMPPLYFDIGAIDQADQQQLLWQIPEVLFKEIEDLGIIGDRLGLGVRM
jgi:hypothetical protein